MSGSTRELKKTESCKLPSIYVGNQLPIYRFCCHFSKVEFEYKITYHGHDPTERVLSSTAWLPGKVWFSTLFRVLTVCLNWKFFYLGNKGRVPLWCWLLASLFVKRKTLSQTVQTSQKVARTQTFSFVTSERPLARSQFEHLTLSGGPKTCTCLKQPMLKGEK